MEGLAIFEDLVPGVSAPVDEGEEDPLHREFRSILRRYNQLLPAFGGNDFEVKHTWVLKRRNKKKINCAYTTLSKGSRQMLNGIQLVMSGMATLDETNMR